MERQKEGAVAKKSYWEKLQDPRWQKKRLAIMSRAEFACEACGNKESTLHVHHGYYERGLEPWEYDDDTLKCLCDRCHEVLGFVQSQIHKEIAKVDPVCTPALMQMVLDFLKHQAMVFEDRVPAFLGEAAYQG